MRRPTVQDLSDPALSTQTVQHWETMINMVVDTEWCILLMHHVHQTSFINFLHLLWSIASSLFNLRAWQSFSHLCPGPLWSSSWLWTLYFILCAFLHSIIIFFATYSHTAATGFAVIPVLCHLFLISLSAAYLKVCLLAECHTSTCSDNCFHTCVHRHHWHTSHSSTPSLRISQLITSLGTLSKAFSKSTKPK